MHTLSTYKFITYAVIKVDIDNLIMLLKKMECARMDQENTVQGNLKISHKSQILKNKTKLELSSSCLVLTMTPYKARQGLNIIRTATTFEEK